jgi:uncharacterized protein (TIGR00725 family)
VVLTSGGAGVAQFAAAGARLGGGLTVGLLAGATAADSPPNPHVEVALFTGLGEARAAVAAAACDGMIAIGGGFGTLAEIGLALRAKKPVVLLGSWRFEVDDVRPNLPRAETGDEAVTMLWNALGFG